MIEKRSLLVMFEGDSQAVESALLNYAMNNGWTKDSPMSKEDYIAKLLWGIITEGAISEIYPEDTQEKEEAIKTMSEVNSYGI